MRSGHQVVVLFVFGLSGSVFWLLLGSSSTGFVCVWVIKRLFCLRLCYQTLVMFAFGSSKADVVCVRVIKRWFSLCLGDRATVLFGFGFGVAMQWFN